MLEDATGEQQTAPPQWCRSVVSICGERGAKEGGMEGVVAIWWTGLEGPWTYLGCSSTNVIPSVAM